MSRPYVVIMAGGSGTRFWPMSRRAFPKQFLSIGGERSLLRQTVERVLPIVPWERILVVTAEIQAAKAREELPELPAENLLAEPQGRNTAPCIGWATRVIAARDPAAKIAVLPADHYVADEPGFRSHLLAALEAAVDHVVLLGLVPTHPETGYGYIKRGKLMLPAAALPVHAVERFVEKPDRATAERYLAEGTYLWNSGMFVFAAPVMDAAIAKHLPALASGLDEIMRDGSKLGAVYPALPSISIDFGVMEKMEGNLVLPSSFGWSDVGSWDAAYDVHQKDGANNVSLGDAMVVDAEGTMVEARSGRFVAVIGVKDLVVVDTPDAVLVVPRSRAQDVKKIVEALQAKGRGTLL